MGADDYMARPFSQRLVIARIRAILRRVELNRNAPSEDDEPVAEPITRGRLSMDPARHKVAWDGKDVTLTVTEFLILETLAARPGIVRSRNQLMDAAYRSEEHTSELQSLMRISYAVFCLKKKQQNTQHEQAEIHYSRNRKHQQ